ncbi:hypothetical protein [Motilimonas pumila]|uniref:Uncharacterized protein n=1 Tax=Motilimonas pumila TaxID=2303987 RepID=A0A418YH54_9GAMM|nr:hypothetical protein [Motilimonas pumila]RJG49432.1 hypothetical protein D1Z90_05590 [Motilimonas pumila]
MNDIHKLEIIPDNQALISVAAFHNKMSSDLHDYQLQLAKLRKTMQDSGFKVDVDAAAWVKDSGRDYLSNPKLLENAPLTYVCTLLCELFKHKTIEEVSVVVTPTTITKLLTRLNSFKLH